MSRIAELLARKRADVARRKKACTTGNVQDPGDDRRVHWNRESGFRVIAEIKRASLSAGPIRPDLQVPGLVRSYQEAGVAAVSVLTEEHFFGGSLEDLRLAASAAKVPILQKDFILDPFQVAEAKQAGASIVLLIARFLAADELASLLDCADRLGMNAIVEVVDEEDLRKLRGGGPVPFLGVNSRNLETLEIDLSRFARLRPLLPTAGSFLIAESGITSVETLREVMDLGYDAALIGEHFLRSADPAAEAAAFVKAAARPHRRPRPKVKICGITSETDAMMAARHGADALGFVFADSPRRIQPAALKRFRQSIPPEVLCVGVFKDQNPLEIVRIMNSCSLDVAQVYEPLNLPVPTWHARLISQAGRAAGSAPRNGEQILWDVKLPREQLPAAWAELGRLGVFAVAGCLDPGNVRAAIEACRPAWVDVARGVEKSPGIKDETLVEQFMRNVL